MHICVECEYIIYCVKNYFRTPFVRSCRFRAEEVSSLANSAKKINKHLRLEPLKCINSSVFKNNIRRQNYTHRKSIVTKLNLRSKIAEIEK